VGRREVGELATAPGAYRLGPQNAGIAGRIFVSEGTVEKHVRSILGKLDLAESGSDHRRVLAVLKFLEAR
jgi:DNA-binding NarL/FixJ family response regulator